jgi:hypothetical protein
MTTQTSALPDELIDILCRHAATYATHYPPVDNADHGPMAYLAMHGLGIGLDRIRPFAEVYQRRLVGFPPPREVVSEENWRSHIGRRESYAGLLAFFGQEIERFGWRATVARYLPTLLSGWVKDALHPIIRLGYGVEFEVPSEVAAGLAYFAIVGDDPAMLDAAKRAERIGTDELFAAARQLRDTRFARGPFNDRYRRILQGVAPPTAADEDVMRSVGRRCLDAFDATHDFFALHLVTSSHAYRICRPYAEDAIDAALLDDVYSVGIAVAYLAIGAPAFARTNPPPMPLPLEALARATDEHDIKLAYSCRAQQRAYGDPAYETLATRYLAGRLPAAP